mmetsp:Transcript_14479/g.36369  ORF Transcript_14479/g.36369 Transcript_14479/m.36369 type:complete len:423 (-) Transcript_14479:136-1404(-)
MLHDQIVGFLVGLLGQIPVGFSILPTPVVFRAGVGVGELTLRCGLILFRRLEIHPWKGLPEELCSFRETFRDSNDCEETLHVIDGLLDHLGRHIQVFDVVFEIQLGYLEGPLGAQQVVNLVILKLGKTELVNSRVFTGLEFLIDILQGLALVTVLCLETEHRPDTVDRVAQHGECLDLVVSVSIVPPAKFVEVFEGGAIAQHGSNLHFRTARVFWVGEALSKPISAALVDGEIRDIVVGLLFQSIHRTAEQSINGSSSGFHVMKVQELVWNHCCFILYLLFSFLASFKLPGLQRVLYFLINVKANIHGLKLLGNFFDKDLLFRSILVLGLRFGFQQPLHSRQSSSVDGRTSGINYRGGHLLFLIDNAFHSGIISTIRIVSEGGSDHNTCERSDDRKSVFPTTRSSLRSFYCFCHFDIIMNEI